MSQPQPPDLPPSEQTDETKKTGPATPIGSMPKGILIAWLVMIFGEPPAFSLAMNTSVSLAAIPPLAIIVIGIVLRVRDRSRTGTGLLLGLLSVIAVAVLLVAACFGLYFTGTFGNMH